MKKGSTELVFVLDRSGSMYGLTEDTIGGFNSMIDKQKAEGGDVVVTTVLFNERIKLIHDRFNINDIAPMDDRQYVTGGCTALLDAVGTAIQKEVSVQRNLPESARAEKVIFVIITDGMENSSCEYGYRDIKKMIRLAGIDRMVTTLNTITREEEKHPIWEVASSHMARRVLVGNLYKELKDPNLIAKISGHVENSKAFNRYRNIDDDMAKEVILKLE